MNEIKTRSSYNPAGVFLLIFLLFTAAIRSIDLQPIGPYATKVGLATYNGWFFRLLGGEAHLTCKLAADLIGYGGIALALVFAVIAFISFCRARGFRKMNPVLLTVVLSYVVFAALYVFFEKMPINYRPVLLDLSVGLEPSYPSSHTLLAFGTFGSFDLLISYFLRRGSAVSRFLRILNAAVAAALVAFRVLANVHWLTDIVGGLLLGTAVLLFFRAAVRSIARWQRSKEAAPAAKE